MLSEDQYMERTPDLVTQIRKLRKAAEKEMNKFTCMADYDVHRVVGQKPSGTGEAVPPSSADDPPKRKPAKLDTAQTAIEFLSDVAEHDDDGEVHQ